MDEKKRRSIVRLAIVGVAALYCLVTYRVDEDKSATLLPSASHSDEVEHYGHMNRQLRAVSEDFNPDEEDSSIPDWLMNADQDGHPSLEEAMQAAIQQMHQEEGAPAELPKYNIIDAIQSSNIFRDSYAVMVYDNIADEFLMLYNSDERATPACKKLRQGFVDFIYLLRKTFPERFCGKDCDELGMHDTTWFELFYIALSHNMHTHIYSQSCCKLNMLNSHSNQLWRLPSSQRGQRVL